MAREAEWIKINHGFDLDVQDNGTFADTQERYVMRIRRSRAWRDWWEASALPRIWLFPLITIRYETKFVARKRKNELFVPAVIRLESQRDGLVGYDADAAARSLESMLESLCKKYETPEHPPFPRP